MMELEHREKRERERSLVAGKALSSLAFLCRDT